MPILPTLILRDETGSSLHNMPVLPPTYIVRDQATASPTETSVPSMTPRYRGDLIAGIIILVIGLLMFSYLFWKKGLLWYKAVRGAKATQKKAVMDLGTVLGTPPMPAGELEPPQELREVAPMPVTDEQRQSQAPSTKLQTISEAATPYSKLSQSATLVASTDSSPFKDSNGKSSRSVKSGKSNNSDDTFNTARETDSEPFPEFDPQYRPSNDLVDFASTQLHATASVRDSQASDTTLGTDIEIKEAVSLRMTSLSPRRLSDAEV
jgi:hypothetical protein